MAYTLTLAYITLQHRPAVAHSYKLQKSLPGPGGCLRFLVYDRLILVSSFFVSLSARLRENGQTDLHEIFREGVVWPWDDLIQFWVNSEKPRDAAMLISLSIFVNINTSKRLDRFVWNFHGRCGVTTGRADWSILRNRAMLPCETRGGVCYAFAPQLVFIDKTDIIWLLPYYSKNMRYQFYRVKRTVERYCREPSCLFVPVSVRLSACNVEVSWWYRLEFLENNFTAISVTFYLSTDPNMALLQREHPKF